MRHSIFRCYDLKQVQIVRQNSIKKIFVGLFLTSVIFGGCKSSHDEFTQDTPPWTTGSVFRKFAIKTDTPLYPIDDKESRREGIVVAKVSLNSAGIISKIEILQSTTPGMEASVRESLRNWEFDGNFFKKNSNAYPKGLEAKLIYYFRFVNGVPTVITAA